MEQRVLFAAAAAARAAAFVRGPTPDDRELEPPHPAFVGFRRMAYVWLEDNMLQPVGDRLRIWIEFMRAQGVTEVRLALPHDAVWVQTGGRMQATWEAFEDEGIVTMRGRAGTGWRPPDADPGVTAERLRGSIATAMAAAAGLRQDELERAIAILDSSGDGSEVSDVAWPYFALPASHYGDAARRLFAAAAAAWPIEPASPQSGEPESHPDPLLLAAAAAAMTAVNSPKPPEPVK